MSDLDRATLNRILDAAELDWDAVYADGEPYRSGLSSDGELVSPCFAFCGDISVCVAFLLAVGTVLDLDHARELFGSMRIGYSNGVVFYFPGSVLV